VTPTARGPRGSATSPPDPQAPRFSAAECEGSDAASRACWLTNVCHIASQSAWVLYAPSEGGAGGRRCLGPVCDEDAVAAAATVKLSGGRGLFRAVVWDGPAPAAAAAGAGGGGPVPGSVAWVPGVGVLGYRHLPSNPSHTVTDDMYPLFWTLRRQLEHPAYVGPGAGADGVGGASDAAPGPEVVAVWDDPHGDAPLTDRYAALFHHVHAVTLEKLHAGSGGGGGGGGRPGAGPGAVPASPADTVCFGRLYVGAPGVTLHRNAGYGNANERDWPTPIDAATRAVDRRAWARWLTLRALGSGGAGAAAGAGPPPPPPRRDTVVLIRRSHTRSIANHAAVEAALDRVLSDYSALGLTRVTVALEDTPLAATAALMQRAAVLVGVHGAGLANMDLMQPGSVVIEIALPPEHVCACIFASWAGALGLHHVPTPVAAAPGAGFDDPVTVPVRTFSADVDVALQTLVAPELGVPPGGAQRPV
jgi:hypothetical protein